MSSTDINFHDIRLKYPLAFTGFTIKMPVYQADICFTNESVKSNVSNFNKIKVANNCLLHVQYKLFVIAYYFQLF